jgi:hypothetical protein
MYWYVSGGVRKTTEKTLFVIYGIRAENLTEEIPNKQQESSALDHYVR